MEYLEAIRIRDAAIGGWKEPKRNFLIGKREKAKYDVVDYIRRTQLLGNEKGDIGGALIEWEEVRISDNCAQAVLKIQPQTNNAQQVAEGKVVFHSKCPMGGDPPARKLSEK